MRKPRQWVSLFTNVYIIFPYCSCLHYAMLTPILVRSPRQFNPDAPACQPCPYPTFLQVPTPHLFRHRFSIADHTQATQRVAEVAQQHPTWPQSRVRGTVARELNLSTVQLRYLLRHTDTPTEPAAAAPSLAA